MLFALKKSARLSSVVVPVLVHTEAPLRPSALNRRPGSLHHEALAVIIHDAGEFEAE